MAKTGDLVTGHHEEVPTKAASTAKIMCAYVVLQLAGKDPNVMDEIVTFSKFADATAGSTSGIKAGEKVTVAECLYGLLLPSGNDAGNALAEHFNDRFKPLAHGDVKTNIDLKTSPRSNFIAEMNRTAAKLGLEHARTTFPTAITAMKNSPPSPRMIWGIWRRSRCRTRLSASMSAQKSMSAR